MSRIEYHEHDNLFPAATEKDVREGTRPDSIVTAQLLGTAALLDVGDLASAEQGAKADEAYSKSQEAHSKSHDAHSKSEESNKLAQAAQDQAKEADTKSERAISIATSADIKSEKAIKISQDADRFAEAAKEIAEGVEERCIEVEHVATLASAKAEKAFLKTDAGALASKDSIDLTDISVTGTKDANHVLSGTGWVSMSDARFGDMSGSVYDPNSVNADAFDMDNMNEGQNNLILKKSERDDIATISDLRTKVAGFEGQLASAKSDIESAAVKVNTAAETTQEKAAEFDRQLSAIEQQITTAKQQFAEEKNRLTESIVKIDTATSVANSAKQSVDTLKDLSLIHI